MPRHIVLQYAEEHPDEVLEVLEDRSDAVVRELEARERSARLPLRRSASFAEDGPPSNAPESVPF